MQVVPVRHEGLVGELVIEGAVARPGVVVLGGSEGGLPTHLARLLTSKGFTCLALRYFGGPGLPRNLVEVPVEQVETAGRWLLTQPQVRGERVGALGASKGAELALLTATTAPELFGAVVAYAPSSVAFAGISFGGDGRNRSSWSHQGSPLPFVPYPKGARPALGRRGLSLAPIYRAALEDAAAVEAAAIPIERARAAIMLLSGDGDRMWPSSAMAQMLEDRLAIAGRRDRLTWLRFADAGHSFMPWAPSIRSARLARVLDGLRLSGFGGLFDLGGRRKANVTAMRVAWPQVVAFLRTNLD